MKNIKDFFKSIDDIESCFSNFLPVKFDKVEEEYNISIIGFDFNNLKLNDTKVQDVEGVIFKQNDMLSLYYDNNKDIKEQRVIIATLIGYLQNIKLNNGIENSINDYYLNLTNEDIFNNNKPYNKMAREILLPKESLEKLYLLLKGTYNEEYVIYMLSKIFVVPENEVILGIKDLGYDINIKSNNVRIKKINKKI